MKNSLSEHSLFVIEQLLGNKRIRYKNDADIIEFLITEIQAITSRCDFAEAMNNEAGRKVDCLLFEYNATKSLHHELYLKHKKLLLDFEKLKSEADLEKLLLENSYNNLITQLKSQLYDEIGSRFASRKSS